MRTRIQRLVPRTHATVIALAIPALLAIMLVSGVVHAEFGEDSTGATVAGSASKVPQSVQQGGPIIDTTHNPARSTAVPAHTVVLTFDDGPDPRWTPEVLAVLRRHHVPATFFVVGALASQHPDLIRDIHDSGSELGVHTFTHPNLARVSPSRRALELSETQLALAGSAGVTTRLLRPPYSSSPNAIDNPAWSVLQEAGKRGYVTVLTQTDSEDWRRPGVNRIVQNATPAGGQGATILMHDAGGDRSQTVAALDRLIPTLQRQGYRFTTVSGVLGTPTVSAAASDVRWRGQALVWSVAISDLALTILNIFLILVGVLTAARLLFMLLMVRRHVRRMAARRAGPPVTAPVSVIVPAYNESACIEATLRSLCASDHPTVEVIVVDDGSTDGTSEVVAGLDLPGVRLIRQPNQGKAAALNTGLRHARHDLIVMVDGDTIFEPDALRRLVQPFLDPRIGAVAGNAKVRNRRRLLGRWQHIEYVVGFNIDRRVYDLLNCMPTVPGAIGAFRRSVLDQVGGVSGDTLAEDTDLTMAVCRTGWRVVYEQAAVARTEAPSSLGQLWRQRYRWSYGTMQAMWKHRHSVLEKGPSGRFGRRGLPLLALFQVVLPVLAPAIDVFLAYGLAFLDPVRTVIFWLGLLALQLLTGIVAFRLDQESMRPLWTLPLQQLVYRQLMYLVIIQSAITALSGARMRWHKLRRSGETGPSGGPTPGPGTRPEPERVLVRT